MTLRDRRENASSSASPSDESGSIERKEKKKHVWLPPRSLLIMTGDARYHWSHSIASRQQDMVFGRLSQRDYRLSFTFRAAFAPGPAPSNALVSTSLEKEHVFGVYDSIATHWHHTRGKRKVHWPTVKAFLESLEPGSLVADVGSGDGKYFGVNPTVFPVGCDRSLRLLQV
jgi:hypothetical protein